MKHFCPDGGWVVDATLPVPDDPTDYHHAAMPDTVGCNSLRCPVCEVSVRQRADLDVDEAPRGGAAALYEATDWPSVPWVDAFEGVRLYACRCTVHAEVACNLTGDPDLDPITDAALPWRCSGHALASLPVDVDGLTVDEGTDLTAVAERVLEDWTPDGARVNARGVPAAWLCRLYGRLHGLEQGSRLAHAVSAWLTADSPSAVGMALFFFERYPGAPGFSAVVELARRELTRSYPVRYFDERSGFQRTPLAVLLRRLATVEAAPDEGDRAAAACLRAAIEQGHEAAEPAWFAGLASVEEGTLARGAVELVQGRSAHVRMLLDGLLMAARPDLLVVAGSALAAEPSTRRALRGWLDRASNRDRPWTLVLRGALSRR